MLLSSGEKKKKNRPNFVRVRVRKHAARVRVSGEASRASAYKLEKEKTNGSPHPTQGRHTPGAVQTSTVTRESRP